MFIRDFITEAKKLDATDAELLKIMAQIGQAESNGDYSAKNTLGSSALGKYQITSKTWAGMQENIRNGKYNKYGVAPAILNQLLTMPHGQMADAEKFSNYKELQDAAALLLAKENAYQLVAAEQPITIYNMYTLHGLGGPLGTYSLKNPETSIEDAFKNVYGTQSVTDATGKTVPAWQFWLNDSKQKNPSWFKNLNDNDSIKWVGGNMDQYISGRVTGDTNVAVEPSKSLWRDALGFLGLDPIENYNQAKELWNKVTGKDNEDPPTVSADPDKESGTVVGTPTTTDDKRDYKGSGNPMSAEIERLRKAKADAKDDAINAEVGGASNVNDLAKANNIKDANKIQVGQKITLPDGSTYTVKSGDTLSKITKDFNARIDKEREDTVAQTVKIIQNPDDYDPEVVDLARAELADEYDDLADAFGTDDSATVVAQPDTSKIDPNQVNYVEPESDPATVVAQPDTTQNQAIGPVFNPSGRAVAFKGPEYQTTDNAVKQNIDTTDTKVDNVSKKQTSTQPDDYAGIKDDEWEYLNGKSKAERGVATTKESRDKYLNYIGILESKMKSP